LTVLMMGVYSRWKLKKNGGINLHYLLISIPSQVGAINSLHQQYISLELQISCFS
ncbi:hypothetical protein MKX03_001015, partial [Papaver bracteatum]